MRALLVTLGRFTLAVAVALAAVAAFIAYGAAGPIDLPWQHVVATMHLDPSVAGTIVRVDATTDLPDGALVDYYFWRDNSWNNDGSLGGVAEVRAGAFSFDRDLAGLPKATWDIYASFSTVWGSEQPSHVTDLFGSQGEHLAGPQVYVNSPGDAKQLLVTTEVDLS